jgi:hypothetical protein
LSCLNRNRGVAVTQINSFYCSVHNMLWLI